MGNLFEYINDKVVISEYISFFDECHVCGKKNSMIFRACGYISENPDPELPKTGSCVSAACIDCIKSGKIIPIGEEKFTEFLRENFDNWDELRKALRETPHIPSMAHGLDWPICCGKLSEFLGFPDSFNELTFFIRNTEQWDSKSLDQFSLVENPPKYLSDISIFQCKNCGKKHWIYQHR